MIAGPCRNHQVCGNAVAPYLLSLCQPCLAREMRHAFGGGPVGQAVTVGDLALSTSVYG